MEKFREHLKIPRWQVFGGSWGSTLSLAYAESHPERVTEMVLRGIFLLRRQEIEWFYQRGASMLFPDAWEEYIRPIPEEERGDLVRAYYRRLTGPDEAMRREAALCWSRWEGRTSRLLEDPQLVARVCGEAMSMALARIECHYFVHRGFLERETQLLDDLPRIHHIPATIVQGRYDVICPMESAWLLHSRWPGSVLRIVPDAGHSAMEPGIIHELVSATDRFAR
ncbi:MAG: prolyl aminopeptidase [Myxococcales bacterium]|nr:prolyl aminopeptidase [Myxococcales bacterium]